MHIRDHDGYDSEKESVLESLCPCLNTHSSAYPRAAGQNVDIKSKNMQENFIQANVHVYSA